MPKSWHDERVVAPEDCVLRPMLEKFATSQPDKVFARFADCSEWTYAQTLQIVRRTAAGLQALGGGRQSGRRRPWREPETP